MFKGLTFPFYTTETRHKETTYLGCQDGTAGRLRPPLLEKTQVWFPAPTLGSTKLPGTPAPGWPPQALAHVLHRHVGIHTYM